jgi:hypothetical protein
VPSFRLTVAAAAQQRGHRGQCRQRGGYGEHHQQAVVERLRDQLREERPAGEDPLMGTPIDSAGPEFW